MKRITWIDTAKAFGIFLVILGHQAIDPNILTWIYSFRMPLFFFISGYLFEPSKYPIFSPFCVKKIRTLIVLYFFFAALSYLFWLLAVRKLATHGFSLNTDPLKPFIGIFYGIGSGGWGAPLNTVLWFLPCLFVTEILIWKLNCSFQKQYLPFVLIGLASLSVLVTISKLPRLPWSVDVALAGSVFYGLGFLYKDFIVKWMAKRYFIISLGAFFILNLWVGSLNGRVVDMNSNNYGNIVLFYISGIAGILFLIGISNLVARNKLFDFIGQNTLVIMCLGGVSFLLLKSIIYLFKGSLPVTSGLPVLMGITYSGLQILLLIPAIYLVNKFLPFIIGRQQKS
ncbi:MAG: hypothetical protein COS99_08790 [Candidatus Omnitrophica bacterium CG07_land_8_20_14_0_80_42_15]|uniref:Acyltransferase 3 domain-containing protein n=1 Tax=Candidatus Aquitaenariimonas noxiae TaxID=1974741 RepID=A0A2J0KQX0_9BACT|nr:MAG: hypothetical protein COS99_08790 [Candidatus Omnitrophica bacterium CG07_land_8_20_14_0_80_42_15]